MQCSNTIHGVLVRFLYQSMFNLPSCKVCVYRHAKTTRWDSLDLFYSENVLSVCIMSCSLQVDAKEMFCMIMQCRYLEIAALVKVFNREAELK